MRLKHLLSSLLIASLAFLAGCGGPKKSGEQDAIPFNPNVEAFTSGRISRTTPVYLILNKEVAQEVVDAGVLKKAMKIKPDVAGEFSFENNRTIVFKPTTEFARDKTYTVTADFGQLLGADMGEKDFSFTFSTMPIALRASFESMDINGANEEAYDFVISVYTPDREAGDVVEPLVKLSEQAEMEWQHAPDGKKHILTLRNLAASACVRMIDVSVASNKLGVPKDNLLSFHVPGKNDFGVYDVVYVSEPERYVEVVFTELLDAGQNMTGLAYIESNKNTTVKVEHNKLRLYPDAGRTGTLTINIDAKIKSKKGTPLNEDISRKIEISSEVPDVRFIGEGTVVPQSAQVLVPFQAAYLRGVVVRVIKIGQQAVGQFLQINQLNGSDELMRVGRLVARKTIFLDEYGQDLSKWGTYAVDLRQLMEPEPGAIYRVELSFDKELSAYPCDHEQLSKEQILVNDEVKFREELGRFDEGGYYYYYDDYYDWYDYDYTQRNNPCHSSFYMYNRSKVGRNVLATNIGVIAKAGEDNDMVVLTHNLLTTQPEKGVEVSVYNFQHQLMGSGSTNDKGYVKIGLTPGRPYYLIASQGRQRSYLRVDNGTSLSLSSFDVAGEVVQKGLKGFIYGDRGVWRPGDAMYLSFMLSDRGGKLPADHPVVMEMYNPMGQLHMKKTQSKGALGIYSFHMQTEQDSPTGAWEVKVRVGGATFTKRVRVESIKPNRLKIDLKFTDKILLRDKPVTGSLHVEWLQGATARNLAYEIDASFNSMTTAFPKFKDYNFDDPTKQFSTEETTFTQNATDEKGDASVEGRLDVGTSAPGMLTVSFNTRVYEESGDFSIDALRMPYSPYKVYAGIKTPQKTRAQLNTGENHKFEVVSVDYNGEPVGGTELSINIHKISWYWWWSSDKNRLANYLSDSYSSRVKNFTVKTNSAGKASFDLNFSNNDWGTYYISVEDHSGGHSTGAAAYFDWPYMYGRRDMEGSDAANKLNFKTDKEEYAPGEKIMVTVPSSEGSRAVVSIENGTGVLSVTEHECKGGETKIQLDVTPEMQPNAYIHITLLQPHGITVNDLPIRMYGVMPVTVTSPGSHLVPVLKAPDEIRPENKYEITVSEKEGREMAYTLAIVDEGLLDLTRFKTPDPWRAFNAREALGVNTWDMYNYVVGAYGGRIEQLFSIGGDDELEGGPKAIVNRFKPVVQFDGPFVLKRGSKQKHTYAMPNYNGRVRVMVVAGDGKAYGSADKSVMVRKPVMLLGTLPRVIGIGEEMVVPATVFATQKGVGNVKVNITCSDNMQVVGTASQTLNFTDITDKSAMFRVKVGSKPGAGKVTITAVSGNDKSVYETDIEIRSVRRSQTKVVNATLEAGKTWKQDVTMPGADGTNKLALEVSNIRPVNLASRLSFLLGYPHGCLEQITSKAFPQLYVKQFASLTKEQSEQADAAIKEVLRRYSSYQLAEGSFAYWPGRTSSNAWGTIFAMHFMLEAEAKGYHVQESVKRNAANNIKLVARNWKPAGGYYLPSEELTQAYRLYVLALAKSPELGAMNRMREETNLNVVAKWMLASAYAQAGLTDVARQLVRVTTDVKEYVYNEYDYTFGSSVRDKALKLMMMVLIDDQKQAAELCDDISGQLALDDWMSTQSTCFSLVALSQYMNKYKVEDKLDFSYTCSGKGDKISTEKNIWSAELLSRAGGSAGVEVRNNGKASMFVRVIMEGIPDQGEEKAYANGLAVEVMYVDANGNPVDIVSLEQGTNFSAVVTVKNPTPKSYNNIVLTQIFPAGWEILNTRFTDENAVDAYPAGVSYQDIRDDRVYSYMDRLPSARQITVTVNLAAVYAGKFYCPPVYAEAMYDNLIRANNEGRNIEVKN